MFLQILLGFNGALYALTQCVCTPKGRVLVPFSGLDFAFFRLELGMVFEGMAGLYERIYRFNSKCVRKIEKFANSNWILRNLFRYCFNLSNNGIIS